MNGSRNKNSADALTFRARQPQWAHQRSSASPGIPFCRRPSFLLLHLPLSLSFLLVSPSLLPPPPPQDGAPRIPALNKSFFKFSAGWSAVRSKSLFLPHSLAASSPLPSTPTPAAILFPTQISRRRTIKPICVERFTFPPDRLLLSAGKREALEFNR